MLASGAAAMVSSLSTFPRWWPRLSSWCRARCRRAVADTGDRRTIETVVTVSVVDALKGEPGTTVYFRCLRASGSLPSRD